MQTKTLNYFIQIKYFKKYKKFEISHFRFQNLKILLQNKALLISGNYYWN